MMMIPPLPPLALLGFETPEVLEMVAVDTDTGCWGNCIEVTADFLLGTSIFSAVE